LRLPGSVADVERAFVDIDELVSMNYVRIRLTAMAKTDRGASAVEYGLLVALIAIAIIVAITALGGKLSGVFSNSSNALPS
jgi:pilus assembly protein Flp/PilA